MEQDELSTKDKQNLEAANLLLDTIARYPKISSLDDFRGMAYQCCVENKIDIVATAQLLDYLLRLQNAHVANVDDLRGVLDIIKRSLENHSGYYSLNELDIPDTLYHWNSSKYFYEDDVEFQGLPIITDSDFIDCASFTNEQYQIIYGPMYYATDFECVYNFIVGMCNSTKAPILRNAWIGYLISTVQRVIEKLEQLQSENKGADVKICIPFLEGRYEARLTATIDLFVFTSSVLQQIRESEEEEIPTEGEYVNCYPIPGMRELMESYFDAVCDDDGNTLYMDSVYNEMTRRGFHPNEKVVGEETINAYRKYLVGITDAEEKAEVKSIPNPEEPALKKKDDSILRRTGVLYCMLSHYGLDLDAIYRICQYVCKDAEPFIPKNSNNTVGTYVYHPNRYVEKGDNVDYIVGKLKKYEFSDDDIRQLLSMCEKK